MQLQDSRELRSRRELKIAQSRSAPSTFRVRTLACEARALIKLSANVRWCLERHEGALALNAHDRTVCSSMATSYEAGAHRERDHCLQRDSQRPTQQSRRSHFARLRFTVSPRQGRRKVFSKNWLRSTLGIRAYLPRRSLHFARSSPGAGTIHKAYALAPKRSPILSVP